MKRNPARLAALAAALIVTSLAPGLGATAAATLTNVTVTGSVRDLSGQAIEGDISLVDIDAAHVADDRNDDDGFTLQAPAGDYTLHFDAATPAGTWSFEAPYHLAADATVDLVIPDAAPADIVVLGPDDQPVTGVTVAYRAAASKSGRAGARHRGPPRPPTPSRTGRPLLPHAVRPVDDRLVDRRPAPSAPPSPSAPATTSPCGRAKRRQARRPAERDRHRRRRQGQGHVGRAGPAMAARRSPATPSPPPGRLEPRANFGPTATSGTIRSLTNGKEYRVTVVAKNANGTGPASAPVTVTLSTPIRPPTTTTTAPARRPRRPPRWRRRRCRPRGPPSGPAGRSGYWLLGADGAVYPFGDAAAARRRLGGAGRRLDRRRPPPCGRSTWSRPRRAGATGCSTAGAASTPSATPGTSATWSPAALAAGEAPASLSATPSGAGYWVFTNRGRAVAFGDATALGDMTGTALNGPVLDSVATPSGRGYYMVASDGGIFAFGDARFAGSMGGKRLNAPVRSLVPDGDGAGYWLVAADGGVFAFDAPFRGSMGGRPLNKPVRGMVRYGDGYLMVGEDGGIFAFSDRPFTGSLGGRPPASPIVSVASL